MDQFHRRYRDLCTDCHNYWQKWQELNSDAISLARSLANDRILLSDPHASSDADPDFDIDQIQARIWDLCVKSESILNKFQSVVIKFRKFEASSDALEKLCDAEMKCKLDRLCKLIRILRKTCDQEFECKKSAFADLSISISRNHIFTCVACFVHQPFVDESELSMLLDAILLESGHKNA